MRPITKTQFAKERQVSRARVYQWIADGRVQVLEDGKIDADDAHARLDANLDQTKGVRREGNITSAAPDAGGGHPEQLQIEPKAPAKRDNEDYWTDKVREQKAVATMAEMKALQQAGALVSAAGVQKAMREIGRLVRNGLQGIPDRTASVLDSANPGRAHKLLTDEHNRLLNEFEARLEQLGAAAAGAEESPAAVQ